MSIERVKTIFSRLAAYDAWALQLLKIKTSKYDGTSYTGREIIFSPEGKLKEFVSEIGKKYTDSKKGILNSYNDIREYDGSTLDKTIYKLDGKGELIGTEFSTLIEAVANPDVEIDPLEIGAQAYLLKGVVTIDEVEHSIKLISMQNPVTNLKHKFLRASGTFKEIDEKVISLRTTIDVLIDDNSVYMLTMAGENLFNMERAYKAACVEKLEDVKACNIVNDFETFYLAAGSGHNPRKFVSFNDAYLQKLRRSDCRRKIARKFNIPLSGDKFDIIPEGAADKLVKILCDRGMIDPFEDNPMEVAGAKRWI